VRSGRRYQVRYRLGGRGFGLLHGGVFVTLKEARIRRDFIAGELAAGRDPRVALATLSMPSRRRNMEDWFEAFVESRVDVHPKTIDGYRKHWKRIGPAFGHRDPVAVTPAEVQEWIAAQAKELKPSSVLSFTGTLRQVLDFIDLPAGNPARHRNVKLPRQTREEARPPTGREFRAIVEGVLPKYRLFVRILEATALRIGELSQLTWGDVNTADGQLRVSIARTKGGTAGQRWVQVPRPLMELLEETVQLEDRVPARLVFPGVTGAGVRASMSRACRLAGLANYSPHDLRHRRASLWHFQGVPLREVQQRVGHSDMSVTGDTYTHVVIDAWDDEWAAR
jgi:integrase